MFVVEFHHHHNLSSHLTEGVLRCVAPCVSMRYVVSLSLPPAFGSRHHDRPIDGLHDVGIAKHDVLKTYKVLNLKVITRTPEKSSLITIGIVTC